MYVHVFKCVNYIGYNLIVDLTLLIYYRLKITLILQCVTRHINCINRMNYEVVGKFYP